MEVRLIGDKVIKKISRLDSLNMGGLYDNKSDFIIVEREAYDFESQQLLINEGFYHAERFLTASVNLNNLPKEKESLIRFHSRICDNCISEIKKISLQSFTKDRRFHLKIGYDSKFSIKLINSYIDEIFKENVYVVATYLKSEIVGFTVIKEISNDACEIKLGAVYPRYQNLGVSASLYLYTSFFCLSKGYKTMSGSISSINLNSLNVFLFLGARISDVYDLYIKENNI